MSLTPLFLVGLGGVFLFGSWTNPFEKYPQVKLDHFPIDRGEHIIFLKRPAKRSSSPWYLSGKSKSLQTHKIKHCFWPKKYKQICETTWIDGEIHIKLSEIYIHRCEIPQQQKVKNICETPNTQFLFGEKKPTNGCEAQTRCSGQLSSETALDPQISEFPRENPKKTVGAKQKGKHSTTFANIAYNTHIYKQKQKIHVLENTCYIYI